MNNSYLQCSNEIKEKLDRIVRCLKSVRVIIVAAGAGMSVEAGIPDYHGGIHNAHPYLAKLGLNTKDISNHQLFNDNPGLAWAHWITRQRKYLDYEPHLGYKILHSWYKTFDSLSMRIITTNLDQLFLRTGFPKEYIFEMHGSMYDAQCYNACGQHPWPLNIGDLPMIDEDTMMIIGEVPQCMNCHGPARICTALAVDGHWYAPHVERARILHEQYFDKLSNKSSMLIFEIGCGTVMAKVRHEATRLASQHRNRGGFCLHVRINVFEADIDEHDDNISLSLNASQALSLIDLLYNQSKSL